MESCDCAAPSVVKGSARGKQVVETGESYVISNTTDQVDVNAEGVTLTLPSAPRIGDSILIAACDGDVNVRGGCYPICGVDKECLVPTCTAIRFTFTACCTWSALA